MPISPSPVITSTRPKSTKLHALPLHVVNYLLLFKLTSSKIAIKLPPACRKLRASRMAVALTSFFVSSFNLLKVNSYILTTAELIGKQGMAWTYLGLQYKIFPATPKTPRSTLLFFFLCSCLGNQSNFNQSTLWVGQFNILELNLPCKVNLV